jgi:hypothetical protein
MRERPFGNKAELQILNAPLGNPALDLGYHRRAQHPEQVHIALGPRSRTRVESAESADDLPVGCGERNSGVGPDGKRGRILALTECVRDYDLGSGSYDLGAQAAVERVPPGNHQMSGAGCALDELLALIDKRKRDGRNAEQLDGEAGQPVKKVLGTGAEKAGLLKGGKPAGICERLD